MADDGFTTAASYESRDEADIAAALLGSAGIPAMVVADDEGGLNPGFFTDYQVRLVVACADLETATAILGTPQNGAADS